MFVEFPLSGASVPASSLFLTSLGLDAINPRLPPRHRLLPLLLVYITFLLFTLLLRVILGSCSSLSIISAQLFVTASLDFTPPTTFEEMFGSKSSPLKFSKHKPADSSSNPFDSHDEIDRKQTPNTIRSRKPPHEPTVKPSNVFSNPFDDHDEKESVSLYPNSTSSDAKYKYKNDFRDAGGMENQSVQELENYAVYKAEETTNTVNSCLKIAEVIREDATKTLVTLHQQGEQITKTHEHAANIDHDLSRGEKLLGSLGGMFSKTWKPKKSRPISGPVITRDEIQRKGNHLEQREKLGLTSSSKGHSNTQAPLPEPTDALQKVEVEKVKQDDGLSDLSDLLGELKGMAVDMGSEMDRQNKALDHLYDDVDEIDFRVKQASQRGRRLLGK